MLYKDTMMSTDRGLIKKGETNMLFNMPEKLMPYVQYDMEKTLVHSEEMPEKLMPLFNEFLKTVKEFNEKRRKEMLG